MSDRYYEHHLAIRKDKLCPFILNFAEDALESISNWHKNVEILLITRGHGGIRYGSRDLPCHEGDLIVVSSGTLHRLYSEHGISYRYLIIDESFCIENGIITEGRVFTPVFCDERARTLFLAATDALTAYYAAESDEKPLKAAKARLSVLSLLVDACEAHSTTARLREDAEKPSEEYVKRAIAHMNDRYGESLTLDGIASVCGISKCHLCREFKRYTGQTVLNYLNALRCKNAQSCLIDGASVTEAAYECGFESISYFSRTYKKIMGISPSHAQKEAHADKI